MLVDCSGHVCQAFLDAVGDNPVVTLLGKIELYLVPYCYQSIPFLLIIPV